MHFKGELKRLLIKIAIIIVVFICLFTFVFGLFQNSDNAMSPAVNNGDLVLYYRLDKDYKANDVIVVNYNSENQIRRVIAVAGDEVDITSDGLVINGLLQNESKIYQETLAYSEGITFPVTVKEGEVFVLGDDRYNAIDSRIYGCVKISDTKGTLITILRRSGF